MDVTSLRASFDLIEPHKDEFAKAFYRRLFEKYPATRQFFVQSDMQQQASALAATLFIIVASVEKGENIIPVLQDLGTRHKIYGVLPEHYPLVGEILLETFQDTLGPQWTPAYQAAWVQAYAYIAEVMLRE